MEQIDVFGYHAINLINIQQPPVLLTDYEQLDCYLNIIIKVSLEYVMS